MRACIYFHAGSLLVVTIVSKTQFLGQGNVNMGNKTGVGVVELDTKGSDCKAHSRHPLPHSFTKIHRGKVSGGVLPGRSSSWLLEIV